MRSCCIALKRVDVPDATGADGIAPEQWAYAWEAGKTLDQMERVVWQSVGFDQQGQEQFAWVSFSQISGFTSVWCMQNGVFRFVSLDAYRSDYQLFS